MVVCNILVDDLTRDPEYQGSRADYFEVRYDGEPLRIPPGETRVLPRYLAEHFAKHLADYILTRNGQMVHDELLRAPLLSQIILHSANETDISKQTYGTYEHDDQGDRESSSGASLTLARNDLDDSKGESPDVPDSSKRASGAEIEPGIDRTLGAHQQPGATRSASRERPSRKP